MRALRRAVLAGLLVLPATLARAEGTVPAGYQVTRSTALHQGVEHVTLSASNPAESVNVARVGPGAPVALKTVSAHDAIPHRTAHQELPSDMCRRVGCIAGINGDFHDLRSDQPFGGVVSGGRLVRSPRAGYGQVTLARDGSLHAGALGWSGSLVAADGTAITLTGVNVDRGVNDVVLYTPAWGASSRSGAETEVVVRAADPVGALGTTTVEIVSTRRASGAIPPDGAVLSATGPAGAGLRELATRIDNGSVARGAQLRLQTAVDAVESIGVHPVLLRDGQRVFPDAADGFTRSRTPRTLFGWNRAGEMFLVTVDGRRDDADGMSLAQAADLLARLGATDAVNFDGGGGTTFVVAGEVKNLPSDPHNPGPPTYPDGHVIEPGHVERMAPNALVIVPKAPDPRPSDSTTTTTGPGGGQGPGSGPADPAGDDDAVLTGGSRFWPGDPTGDTSSPSENDPAFLTGGAGAWDRLVLPSLDEEQRKGTKGRGKGRHRDSDAVGNLNGDWLPVMPPLPGFAPGDSALAAGPAEDGGPLLDLAFTTAAMVAAGMVLAVLAGINSVRRSRRPRPALWL